jgi:aspartate/methionine/tyrosine aminotransferase
MSPRDPIRPAVLHQPRNGIGDVAKLALGHPDVIPLWFGETDLVTPDFISAAAKKALDDGRTFYTFANGVPALRQAIVDFTRRFMDVEIDLNRVTVPGSAMLGVSLALQCLIETGDNIVVVAPIWPNIFMSIQALGGESKFVNLKRDRGAGGWSLDLDEVKGACDARTKAIFVASPGNPSGWVMSREQQMALLDFARARGIAIIADEVYGTLVYEGKHAPSFLQLASEDDHLFTINSFSKAWAMTGWRIGWIVAPKRLLPSLAQLSAVANTGATTFAQYGALAALQHGDDFVQFLVERCRKGREIVDGFVKSNNRLSWSKPPGAFYGFVEIDGLTNSFEFAKTLVQKHKVGVAPGSAFGPGGNDPIYDRYIRLCFGQDGKRLSTALDRLSTAVREL